MTHLRAPIIDMPCQTGGRLTFHSLHEVRRWVAAERAYWRWLRRKGSSLQQRVRQAIQDALQTIEMRCRFEDIAAVQQAFAEIYGQGGMLHSRSTHAAFITSLRKENVERAAYVAAVVLRLERLHGVGGRFMRKSAS